ncbi:MAG: ribonuclease III [Muribaculaceae bacterium]|nr:ribonuclease III [Muribaculaceae bacterium]MBR6948219.1 ribonuclease III [Muribaculaceae bacterium]
MPLSNAISLIKLLFIKDKELYVFIHRTTGYYPHDIKLYQLAMVHRSKPVKMPDGRWANNERLEYLGDAVLDTVVADFLYKTYPSKHEGFLTATRAKIVQRESLNRIGNSLHLDSHVRAMMHTSSHNSYICGNALEALVGAVYLDQGYERCSRFIINRLIKKHFDLNDLVKTEQNFKSRLIEWTQKYRVSIEFELVDSHTDNDKNPVFRTAVILGGIYASDAEGYSKKESHQSASKKALDRLEHDQQFREQILATAAI